MFSNRCLWDIKKNEISLIIEEKKKNKEILLDLTISNPTECGFNYEESLIKKSFLNNNMFKYNPDPHGLIIARNAIADYYFQEFGLKIDINRIFLTTSTSESYSYIFKLLCNFGNNILVPQPGYPLFEYLAGLEGIKIKNYFLEYIHCKGWFVDFDSIKSNFDKNTKGIVIVNPNNPTGSFIKNSDFEKIKEFCLENNLFIISDEVFSDYLINKKDYTIRTLVNFDNINIFILNGFSKMLGLPQFKVGWFIINSNSNYIDEIINRMEIITDTYLTVNTPIQLAIPDLFKTRKNIQSQILKRINNNLEIINKVFSNDKNYRILDVEGGWSCIIEAPRVEKEENIVKNLLIKYNIQIYPGYFFDFGVDNYFVISLLTQENILEKGLIIFKKYYDEILC